MHPLVTGWPDVAAVLLIALLGPLLVIFVVAISTAYFNADAERYLEELEESGELNETVDDELNETVDGIDTRGNSVDGDTDSNADPSEDDG